MKTILTISGIVLIAIAMLIGYSLYPEINSTTGELGGGGGDIYYSTTTSVSVALTPNESLKTGPGSLGSIIITSTNAGTLEVYDATTTNYLIRTGRTATSSLFKLASFPTVAATGTYPFDTSFADGLITDFVGVSRPTATITWR
jgi:hypothetical protein